MAESAGTIYAPIELRLGKLETQFRTLNSKFDTFGSRSKQRAGGFQKAWSAAFTSIGFLGAQAITKLLAGIKQGIGVFAGFQQSIANVVSVTKAFGEEQRLIEKAAKDAGETTRFSARQSADALYFLASAGLDARQSIAALDGVLQLAGATQSDLATTASSVTAIISQFNLQASDATRVSNVFAAAIGNSQANMEKLTNAFRQVGPVAAGLGLNLEETTGILQVLFNAGFRGQQAGRALKSALADLASPTENIRKKFKALNIDLEKVNPTTNDFASIIDELAKSGATTADIIDAFGKVAGPQIAVLVSKGADAIRDYTDAVTGTNAAAEAYRIQNQTLQGSIDILRSKTESLAIAFFGKLDPGLRKLINSFINLIEKSTPLINIFGKFINFVLQIVSGPLDLLGKGLGFISEGFSNIKTGAEIAAGTLAIASDAITKAGEIDKTVNNLNDLIAEYDDLNSKSELTGKEQKKLEKIITDIEKIVPGTTVIFDEYGNAIEDSGAKAKETARQLLIAREAILSNALTQLKAGEALYKETVRRTEADAKAAEANRNRLIAESTNAQARIAILDKFKTELELQQDALKDDETIVDALNKTLSIMDEEFKKVGLTFPKQINNINEVSNQFNNADQEIAKANKTLENLRKSLAEPTGAEKLYQESLAKLQEIAKLEEEIKKVQEGLTNIDKIDPIKEEAPKKTETLREKQKRLWQELLENLQKATREARIFGDEQDILTSKIDFLKDAYLDLIDNGLDPTSDILTRLKALYDENVEALDNLVKKQKDQETGIKIVSDVLKDHKKKVKDIGNAYKTAFDQAGESIVDFKQLVTDTLPALTSLFDSVIGLFDQFAETRLAAIDEQLQAELEAAGVAEETNLQRIEKELEVARKAGDEEKVNELEKEKKKEKIILEFEKKKAQAEYQGALYTWGLTLLNASAKLAEAILVATAAAPWPANLPAIGYAAGAGIKVGTISAQQPKPPKIGLERGGIVPGTQTSGDNIPAFLNAREGVFTLQDQRNLFDFIRNLGTNQQMGNLSIVIPIELDGDIVAQATVTRLNDGQLTINPDRALR